MKILSHRGLWREPREKNTVTAFVRSFAAGLGTETDVRDLDGELVISHDPPTDAALRLNQFLALLPSTGLPLAVNIKADGIAERVARAMAERGVTDWFTFDMSIPDTVRQARTGVPYFLRMSDYERTVDPTLYAGAKGVWLDAFVSETWYDATLVRQLLADGKRVCIVSPELHGRNPTLLWAALSREGGLTRHPGLMLCTDHPLEARSLFDR